MEKVSLLYFSAIQKVFFTNAAENQNLKKGLSYSKMQSLVCNFALCHQRASMYDLRTHTSIHYCLRFWGQVFDLVFCFSSWNTVKIPKLCVQLEHILQRNNLSLHFWNCIVPGAIYTYCRLLKKGIEFPSRVETTLTHTQAHTQAPTLLPQPTNHMSKSKLIPLCCVRQLKLCA